MDNKIVVLIRTGIPYKNTIIYGRTRAREAGAKLMLVGVVPDMNSAKRRFAFASLEFGPYEAISRKFKEETAAYLERAVQFCLDCNLTVETAIQSGGIEEAATKYSRDTSVQLVIVPSPSRKEHHSEFLDAINHFAHRVFENEIRCPVVSVLAT